MESRLLLSGTDVDTSLFNLDSFAADYAVISPANLAPGKTASLVPAAPLVDFDGALVHGGSLAPGSLTTGFAGSLPDYRTQIGDSGFQSSLASPPPVVLWHAPDVGEVGTDVFPGEGPGAPLDGANSAVPNAADTSIVVGNAPNERANESDLPVDGDVMGTPAVVRRTPSVALIDAAEKAFEALGSDDLDRSEGGMIPLESLVAALEDGSLAGSEDVTHVAATSRQELRNAEPTRHPAATFAATELSGELTRAVAFEMIETEAAPLAATSATAHDRALAAVDIDAALTLSQLSSSLGPIPSAALAGAIAEFHDTQLAIDWPTGSPAEWLAGEMGEAGRGNVASRGSEQGAEESGAPPRPVPAAVADWRTSIDVTAFVVVLALERFVSANRRRDRDVAGPPKPVCGRAASSNDSTRKAE